MFHPQWDFGLCQERPALDFTLHFAVALPGNSPRLVPMLLSAGADIDGSLDGTSGAQPSLGALKKPG
jgi:hypothetical protein